MPTTETSKQSCTGAIVILVVIASLIVLRYVYLLKTNEHSERKLIHNDVMNRIVIDLSGQRLSWWRISHFLMYFVLGFLFPQCWLFLVIVGFLWEVFEFTIQYFAYQNRRTVDNQNRQSYRQQTASPAIDYDTVWWTGSFQDIVYNLLGLFVGVMLARIIR